MHKGRLQTSAHPPSPFRPPLIARVGVRNYKSIGACSVPLGPIQFLVGPNGAGKSNFLDALTFVSDALNGSVEQALRDRLYSAGELLSRSQMQPDPAALDQKVHLVLPIPSNQR